MKVFINAIITGILVVIVGNIVGFALRFTPLHVQTDDICQEWNKRYIMEASLFLTGVLIHLIAHYARIYRCK